MKTVNETIKKIYALTTSRLGGAGRVAMLLLAVMTLTTSQAKSKMSPWLAQKYRQQQETVRKNGGPLRVKGRPVCKYMLTLVQSSDEANTVREKGGVVLQDFGDGICAAFLPMDSLGILEQCATILRMEANEPPKLLNDTSALLIGVDKVVNAQSPGSLLPQAFTGKGVIAAVVDVGFDFTHPAFRNDDGTSRIKWFWDPMAPDANNDILGMVYDSPQQVLAARYCTNANISNHGSHVLGSMAGRGLDGRYVGMAPEADIMGAYLPIEDMSEEYLYRLKNYIENHIDTDLPPDSVIFQIILSDVTELVEIYRIFEQADAAGQPCVVNCSFGTGFNFYTDNRLYEQVFNQMVGPGHIVVAATGNEGLSPVYVKKQAFQPLEQKVYYYGYENESYILYLRTEPGIDFKAGLTFANVADTIFFDSRDVFAQDSLRYSLPEVDVNIHSEDAAYDMKVFVLELSFKGEYYQAMTNPENGITGVAGKVLIDTPVEVDLRGIETELFGVVFNVESIYTSLGRSQGTINYPASAERSIAVGAMHYRSDFVNILGDTTTTETLGSHDGILASFSSCGPTMSGLVKPDVVAPGHNIISVLNNFYRVNNDDEATYNKVVPLTAYAGYAYGMTYAMWAMSGTSMASPIVAGVIALWLQAKPDLTPEEIKEVIRRTSHQPEPDVTGSDKNVYYGWGEIDAYAGLLDILQLTDIPGLSRRQPVGVQFRLQGRTLYIDGAPDGTPVRIYTTDGRLVASTSLKGGSISLPAASTAGIYAVQLGQLGSTLIRLSSSFLHF